MKKSCVGKMKVAIVDIKPNTPKYDACLTAAIKDISHDNLEIFFLTSDTSSTIYSYKCRVVKLCRFFHGSVIGTNNLLKAFNWLFDYLQVLFLVYKNKYDIVHFEWLVFFQKSSLELLFIRLLSKYSKIILTVHNIYPHSIDIDRCSKSALAYRERFHKLDKIVDRYIVHTKTSALELSHEFGIPTDRISICIHGLFLPERENVEVCKDKCDNLYRISMFGVQSPYKGTDLLIEAISLLSSDIRRKIAVTISGISTDYRGTIWPQKALNLGINWNDKLLDDAELHELLNNSDLIIFPYRVISQSGALLLALSYRKPIVVSALASFKETLSNCPDSIFFRVGDALDLSHKIAGYVNGQIDTNPILKGIDAIQKDYSWESAAKQTINTYESTLNIKGQ